MSLPRVARAELTSTETSASVWSMTIAPPEGRFTVRANAVSIWCSIWNRENSGGIVAVALDLVRRLRHHVAHELMRLLVDVVGVDQDLADVGSEVVADRADDERALLVDQERALAGLGGAVDRAPELEQVVQVPLQLGGAAADAGGAGDQAHALGVLELVEVFLQLLAVLALDPTETPPPRGLFGISTR